MSIVWLHGDSLTPTDPALVANPTAPVIFIFDEPFLRAAGLSFKRLMFLYESALAALHGRNGAIRRGEVIAELHTFAAEHQSRHIHVTASVSPRFQRYITDLRPQFAVTLHQAQPFTDWRGTAPRRFSAYWRKVESEALRPTGDGPPELAVE